LIGISQPATWFQRFIIARGGINLHRVEKIAINKAKHLTAVKAGIGITAPVK
jgi:hypothetical protein